MRGRISRRMFLRKSAVAAGAAAAASLTGPYILRAGASPNSRLGTAVIGCGGRGGAHVGPASGENLIALVDVDEGRLKDKANQVKAKFPEVKLYADYRKMFDEVGKQIDAVFVATPDHSHAPASMLAIKQGKHCYTEKPLAWSVQECRALAQETAKRKVATQMGNQGHANQGNRLVVTWIQKGLIGDVQEVHTWTNRPVWPQGIAQRPPTQPVPSGLDWDCWIGPAAHRDYHDSLHNFKWRGWFDFGCGAIGDMGCHTWDNVYWSMEPDYPLYVELLEINGKTEETFPSSAKFKWVFPAKPGRAAFTAYWYSGGLKPEAPEELTGEGGKLPGSGSIYIGAKGKMMVSGDYGNSPAILPYSKFKEMKDAGEIPESMIPPSPGHHAEFLMAARGEQPWNFPKSNFAEYAGPMTEIMGLGAIAIRIGEVGFKLECDPAKREVKTKQALAYVGRQYRKGWTL